MACFSGLRGLPTTFADDDSHFPCEGSSSVPSTPRPSRASMEFNKTPYAPMRANRELIGLQTLATPCPLRGNTNPTDLPTGSFLSTPRVMSPLCDIDCSRRERSSLIPSTPSLLRVNPGPINVPTVWAPKKPGAITLFQDDACSESESAPSSPCPSGLVRANRGPIALSTACFPNTPGAMSPLDDNDRSESKSASSAPFTPRRLRANSAPTGLSTTWAPKKPGATQLVQDDDCSENESAPSTPCPSSGVRANPESSDSSTACLLNMPGDASIPSTPCRLQASSGPTGLSTAWAPKKPGATQLSQDDDSSENEGAPSTPCPSSRVRESTDSSTACLLNMPGATSIPSTPCRLRANSEPTGSSTAYTPTATSPLNNNDRSQCASFSSTPSTPSRLPDNSEPTDLSTAGDLETTPSTTSEAKPVSQSCRPTSQQANSHQREHGWTASLTWMSDEEKERRHWETIQANLSHHGFDRSPFVPRTFGEYLVHRLHIVSEAINAARERLRQREEHAELIRRHLSAGTPPEQLPGSLTTPQSLLARAQNSSPPLSPVLARPSIWTNARDSNDSNWPSISELKNAGAARAAKGQSRFFPAPRTNDPDDVFVAGATQNGVRASGSSFPGAAGWDLPSVRRDILTVYEADALDDPTQELGLWELNETIQGLIERIDETE